MTGRRTAAAARAAAPQLSIRRPLVRPPDARGVMRLVRGLPRPVLVLGVTLVVLSMARVWLQLQTVDVGYELSAARQMQLRLEHERRELEVEMATLRDPARVADIARRRLGLVEPRKGQVVVLP
jgi:cell division protein FtsL